MKRTAQEGDSRQTAWLPPVTTAFVASYLVTASGIVAVALTVDHAGFTRTVLFLLTTGYVASFAAQMDHLSWGRILRGLATGIGLGSIPLLSFFISPSSIFPVEVLTEPDLRTAVMIAWLAVILSYLVGSYVLHYWIPLSFQIVPTLSMFGLIGTMNPNTDVVVAFVVFLFSAVFLVSYESVARNHPTELWSLPRLKATSTQHLVLSSAFLVPVMLCTLGVTALLQVVAPPEMGRGFMVGHGIMLENLVANWTHFTDAFDVRSGTYTLSDTHRMTVYCREGTNWRGRVYNQYYGGGWRREGLQQESLSISKTNDSGFIFGTRIPRHHREVVADFEYVAPMPNVLYSPGAPLRVQMDRSTLRVDPTGSMQTVAFQPVGSRYRVFAVVPMVEEQIDVLRRAKAAMSGYLYDMHYLEVPREAAGLKKLSDKIIAEKGLDKPYPKAEALMDYLHRNCKYSLLAPRVPPSRDAAEFFVFESHRGACDLFSTALALMCRSVRIPARVVTGYAPGRVDPSHSTAYEQAFVVTDEQAHAWVEIYINPEWGWIPMDPAAGAEEEKNSWFSHLVGAEKLKATLRKIKRNTLPAAITLLLLYCAVQLVRQPRDHRKSLGRASRRLTAERRDLCQVYLKMCHLLRKAGFPRSLSHAPTEFLEILRSSGEPSFARGLSLIEKITHTFLVACYSARPVTAGEVAAARDDFRKLRQIMKQASRRTRRKRRVGR